MNWFPSWQEATAAALISLVVALAVKTARAEDGFTSTALASRDAVELRADGARPAFQQESSPCKRGAKVKKERRKERRDARRAERRGKRDN